MKANLRAYQGPLTVLAAGVLGFSLFCIASAAALINPGTTHASDIEPQDIVDSAFSNPISTAVAMTVVEIYEYIPTATPSERAEASVTAIPSGTPTVRAFITWTPVPPTRTRIRDTASPTRFPTSTPTRIPPTNTSVPTSTPVPTDTPVPTETPPPPDTNTPEPPTVPPDTETPPPEIGPTPTDAP